MVDDGLHTAGDLPQHRQGLADHAEEVVLGVDDHGLGVGFFRPVMGVNQALRFNNNNNHKDKDKVCYNLWHPKILGNEQM